MGDGEKAPLRLQFNPKVRLEFHGSAITSDAGLLPIRELDEALGLTSIASNYLQESHTGRNIRHQLVPLLRQSIFSRLAGYDDTNDADRLAQDPAMRVVVGWQGSERNGASTSQMGWFETERLSCHRFVANQVRLLLFILVYNLGNFLWQLGLPKVIKDWSLRSVQVKLIKIGGQLVRHARRLVFQLAEVAVQRALFQGVLEQIGRLSPASS